MFSLLLARSKDSITALCCYYHGMGWGKLEMNEQRSYISQDLAASNLAEGVIQLT